MQLDSPIDEIFRLKETQKKALGKLNIKTVENLLRHIPSRYGELIETKLITEAIPGEVATICGKITNIKKNRAFKKRFSLTEATIEDETGKIKATWFHQPYIVNMLKEGSFTCLSGKITQGKNGAYLANPDFSSQDKLSSDLNNRKNLFSDKETVEKTLLIPIYPESRGVSSKWLHHSILKILRSGAHKEISDPIPTEILKKYKLPSLEKSLVYIHTPKNEKDARVARKRFAFEEIFFIQLSHLRARAIHDKDKSIIIDTKQEDIDEFLNKFPFKPTNGQLKAIKQITEDLKKDKPMARLLEGDVGSGKTLIAVTASYAVVESGFQVAYMAPTEILAQQLFKNFTDYFKHLGVWAQVGLITGSECRKFPSKSNPKDSTHISRTQLLKWVKDGSVPILIGTHSLIQKGVKLKNPALMIIDEQHRFGTAQRAKLARDKAEVTPHLLSMTATPIPRTLALTIYSDLDLTILDEMPPGRKQIITEIVSPVNRTGTYAKIRDELKNGRQVYVICPRIDLPAEAGEPDLANTADGGSPGANALRDKALSLNVKSVKEEAVRLKKDIFQEFEIGILHSKLKPKEKEEIMQKFSNGEIDILVATSVVEVGVNVPNATIIIIEGADRFGLAQLHQLRGRVLRSNHQAYCFVFTDSKSKTTTERLKALKTSKNGFELAEYDLSLRGPGELGGGKQWGISDIGMEAIKNIKMVEAAREESQRIIKEDPELEKYPLIKERITNQKTEIHFE
ncbi:MAG: ATP-dependent DNA helicase RecG [Parcubacteria group bacterium]|nr:ATP-dependent DNA helicase RecG [Parcubacteria group bacterium]MCR4343103.1 ATP-dependent DNA helicase RecG [Patescibacteria group bacterium]